MTSGALTFEAPHRPAAVRALNAAGRVLAAAGWRPPSLDPDALLASAERATGLRDWDDPGFRPWFELLLADIERSVPLTLLGRVILRKKLGTLLTNRLKVREALRAHPEIERVPLERPVFVMGFPRTGTTLLHQLLALDPAARAPRLWEVTRPAPPPRPADERTDPRIAEVERLLRSFRSLVPQTDTIHPLRAEAPEECYYLLESAFLSPSFGQMFELPGYWRALLDAPPGEWLEPYRRFRRQAQMLLVHHPERHWVSKSPVHMFGLDALLAACPDARIVITHRDPAACIPSAGSLVASVRSLFVDHLDFPSIGRFLVDSYVEAERRARAAEAAHPEASIVHVDYDSLVADPVATLTRLHAGWRVPLADAHVERARAHLAANPQHAHGVHRYSLEQFGLSEDGVRAATAGAAHSAVP